VFFRLVPQNLWLHYRHQCVALRQKLLDLYRSDKEQFCRHLVTEDETWIHYWDPERKLETMQWKHVKSPIPKKFRTQTSAGKVMVTIFLGF